MDDATNLFSSAQMADVRLFLGDADGSASTAACRHREEFPTRRVLDQTTFLRTDRSLTETVMFQPQRHDCARKQSGQNS